MLWQKKIIMKYKYLHIIKKLKYNRYVRRDFLIGYASKMHTL